MIECKDVHCLFPTALDAKRVFLSNITLIVPTTILVSAYVANIKAIVFILFT